MLMLMSAGLQVNGASNQPSLHSSQSSRTGIGENQIGNCPKYLRDEDLFVGKFMLKSRVKLQEANYTLLSIINITFDIGECSEKFGIPRLNDRAIVS
jgi:hypothetical protein